MFRSFVAACIADLCPRELVDLINEAYHNEWIAAGFADLSDFDRALERGEVKCLKRLKQEFDARA